MSPEDIENIKAERKKLQKRREDCRKVKMVVDAEFTWLQSTCEHPGLKYDSEGSAECNICGRMW